MKKVWLSFEKELKDQTIPIIEYSTAENIALDVGISDTHEILNSITFLNDLGSIQYFENDRLKNKVITSPQVFAF